MVSEIEERRHTSIFDSKLAVGNNGAVNVDVDLAVKVPSASAARVVLRSRAFKLVRLFLLESMPRDKARSIFVSTRSCDSPATSATSLTMRNRARSSILFSRKERLLRLLK